jgi:hypothetical protein
MKPLLAAGGAVALFIAANVAVVQADLTGDLAAIAAVVGVGSAFGLIVGRWWAVAAPVPAPSAGSPALHDRLERA